MEIYIQTKGVDLNLKDLPFLVFNKREGLKSQ